MINQCSSCGGFCKKSGCERENVKPTPQRTWVDLTEAEIDEICLGDEAKVSTALKLIKDKNNV